MLWGYQLRVFVLFQLVDYSALETLRFMRVCRFSSWVQVASISWYRIKTERRLEIHVVEFVADFSLAGFLGVRVTAVEYSCSHVV